MALKKKAAGNYIDPVDNVDPRRKQELMDARRIQEDPIGMANLSDKFIHQEFDAGEFPERLAMYNQSSYKKI
ncbi:MAG TPA: hypothetical protein VHA52_02385 [Candidatus Babeliaceae bacterium]|nr:hypothetical protein [Candidatus Babeliaceae bacterium]